MFEDLGPYDRFERINLKITFFQKQKDLKSSKRSCVFHCQYHSPIFAGKMTVTTTYIAQIPKTWFRNRSFLKVCRKACLCKPPEKSVVQFKKKALRLVSFSNLKDPSRTFWGGKLVGSPKQGEPEVRYVSFLRVDVKTFKVQKRKEWTI